LLLSGEAPVFLRRTKGGGKVALIDSFGRKIDYLRVSVTDRCDFRCSYCMPPGFRDLTHRDDALTGEEITRLAGVFVKLGIRKIRLTGGEPLVRADIVEIAQAIRTLQGLEDLSLSTNGSQLARYARPLYEAGVRRINVSLDSLEPRNFYRITRGQLAPVLEGLRAAREIGMAPIKLNMLILRGINDHEVEKMVEFAAADSFTLRFIETMPVGLSGAEGTARYLPLNEIESRLRRRFALEPTAVQGAGPAWYLHVRNTGLVIGFITPMSQHFCETCNRVRISADGQLYLCLGKEDRLDLRKMIRSGGTDAEIRAAIRSVVAHKPRAHSFEIGVPAIRRVMSLTGG